MGGGAVMPSPHGNSGMLTTIHQINTLISRVNSYPYPSPLLIFCILTPYLFHSILSPASFWPPIFLFFSPSLSFPLSLLSFSFSLPPPTLIGCNWEPRWIYLLSLLKIVACLHCGKIRKYKWRRKRLILTLSDNH